MKHAVIYLFMLILPILGFCQEKVDTVAYTRGDVFFNILDTLYVPSDTGRTYIGYEMISSNPKTIQYGREMEREVFVPGKGWGRIDAERRRSTSLFTFPAAQNGEEAKRRLLIEFIGPDFLTYQPEKRYRMVKYFNFEGEDQTYYITDELVVKEAFWDNDSLSRSETLKRNRKYSSKIYEQLLDSFDDVPSTGKRSLANKIYPESYAGAYQDDEGKLVILIADSINNIHSYRDYANSDYVSIRAVKYSLNALNEVMDKINAYMREHPKGIIWKNIDLVARDEIHNRIIVDVKQMDKEYEELFRSLVTDSPLVFFQDEFGEMENV